LRAIINKGTKIKESKMRITKTQLKQIIKEELTVNESSSGEQFISVPSGFTKMCMESIHILISEGNAQGLRFVDSIGEIQRCLTKLSTEGM